MEALYHASIARSVTKADRHVEIGSVRRRRGHLQHTDTIEPAGMLCACRERPRRRTAEERDELAPPHEASPSTDIPGELRLSHSRRRLLCITAKFVGHVAEGSVASHPDVRDAPGMSAMPPIANRCVATKRRDVP